MKIENIGAFVNLYFRSILTVLLLACIMTVILGGLKYRKISRLGDLPGPAIVLIFIAIYTLVFSWLSYRRYMAFHSYHDMTANLEALWNIFRTGLPLSTAEGSLYELPVMNWFGIHFTPLIYVFSLIIFPFRFPGSIFVLQSLLLASGALAIYLLAGNVLKNKMPAIVFSAVYLLYPTLQYTNLYEFEFFRFVTPLLLWAFYFINKRYYYWGGLFLFLTLLAREDAAPVVLALGIYIFFALKNRKYGSGIILFSVIYGLLTQLVFRPLFCGQATDFVIKNVFAEFGGTPLQVLTYFAFHPIKALFIMFAPLKIMNLVLLLLPLGFLSFASPWLLLVGFSGMVIPLLAPGISQANIFLHKFAAAIPFLFISSIYGFDHLSAFLSKRMQKTTDVALTLSIYLLVAGLLSNIYFGPSPISRQFWDRGYRLADFRTHDFHRSYYESNEHQKIAHEIIEMIPVRACISTEHFFAPHLYNRTKLYEFPAMGNDVDYVLIDRKNPNKRPEFNPGSKRAELAKLFLADPAKIYDKLEKDKNYTKVISKDGIELLRKKER